MSEPNVNSTRPLRIVDQRTMEKIFAVTDGHGVSREAIRVPLVGEGEGRIHRLPDGTWEIVVPASGELEPFLAGLDRLFAGGGS